MGSMTLAKWKIGMVLALVGGVLTAGGEKLTRQKFAASSEQASQALNKQPEVAASQAKSQGHPEAGQVAAAQPPAPIAEKAKTNEAPQTPIDAFSDPLPPHALARLGTVRFRIGQVRAMALSPEGKVLATAGSNGFSLWSIETGHELRRFGKVLQPESIAFANDGAYLVAPFNQDIQIWDVKTGKIVRELKNPGQRFSDVAVSGKIIAGLDPAGSASLWDAGTGRLLHFLKTEDGRKAVVDPGLIAFSPDGQTLGTRGPAGVVSLWDVNTGQKKQRLIPEPHLPEGETTVKAFVFSPDGNTLATGGYATRIWDVHTGKEIRSLPKDAGGALRLTYSSDGRMLATVHGGGSVRIWDTANNREVTYFPSYEPFWVKSSTGIAFVPGGKTFIAAAQSAIRLWDVDTSKEITHDRGHSTGLFDQCVVPTDQRTVITVNWDGSVRQWDLDTGEQIRRIAGLDPAEELIIISPTGALAVSRKRSEQQGFRLYDLRSGKELARLGGKYETPLAFSPDGNTLYTDYVDEQELKDHPGRRVGYTRAWNLDILRGPDNIYISLGKLGLLRVLSEPLKVVRTVVKHDDFIVRAVISPDGKHLGFIPIESESDSNLFVYHIDTGAKLCQIPVFFRSDSFAFSPDGQTLAVANRRKDPGAGSVVEVWDIGRGKKLREMATEPMPRSHLWLAVSPDGKTLVTSDLYEHSIRLWEFATGGERFRLTGHTGGVEHFAFADHGRKLITASRDSTALVWDISAHGAEGGAGEAVAEAWKALAASDASKAYEAIWSMVRTPKPTVVFFRDHLNRTEPPDGKAAAQLVVDLASPDFTVRQKASIALIQLNEAAAGPLREALASNPTLELRQRIEALLLPLEAVPVGGKLQKLRAVEVLEHIGTPDAVELLRTLATGAPGARLTCEAAASLGRLSKQTSKLSQ